MTDCRIQPIGLGYLAGSVKRHFPDMNVRIYDALAGGERQTIAWPPEFTYLRRYYGTQDSGPFSLFHHFYRFGKCEKRIAEDLKDLSPFLIGISCLFTPYYRQSLDFAYLCRKLFPGVAIVMGGSHATMNPETLLRAYRQKSVCDFVLTGEAEQSICELIEMLLGLRAQSAVHNLISKDDMGNSQLLSAELPTFHGMAAAAMRARKAKLAGIPLPDFSGIDPEDYTYNGKLMSFLITSRSCPHRCTFCSIHAVFGAVYRIRTVDDILTEIQVRYQQGIRHFDIEDDNFTVNKNEVSKLLDGIIDMNLPITLSAMNGLSYISLDEALLRKMRLAGFSSLNLSLVSSDTLVLEFTERPHTVKKFLEIVNFAELLDYRVTAYFILGMPRQTLPELWRTLCLLARTRCLVGASPFYFTPGSPIHLKERNNPSVRLESQNHGDPYFSARLTAMDLECEEFDRDDIFTLFRLTRVINYVKKGLDRQYLPGNEFYLPASEVLRDKSWVTKGCRTKTPLPFSKKVANLIKDCPLVITGYRSKQSMRWNSAKATFVDVD